MKNEVTRRALAFVEKLFLTILEFCHKKNIIKRLASWFKTAKNQRSIFMTVRKLTIFSFFLFLPFLIFADTGERYFENEGDFSICPPNGWTVVNFPGLKYKIIYTNAINGFSPNITIADEEYSASLTDYMKLSVENLQIVAPGAEILKNENFRTNNRMNGKKLVFIFANSGRMLRLYQYIFENKNIKICITGTVPNSEGDRFESMFDECAKTFEFINGRGN
ncbi:MAG: hypothetical protein LBK73_08735 [Treponema sp.]|jgi:hypothetical protein|nr:hypothetical protein [Treponema sp.]